VTTPTPTPAPVVPEPTPVEPSAPTTDETVTVVVPGAKPIYIYQNGELLEVEAVLSDSILLVPVRAVSENLDLEVEYIAETKTIIVNKSMYLNIGSEKAILDGEEFILGTVPKIINDRTYVPVRFIAEAFGFDVQWYADDVERSVYLTNIKALIPEEYQQ